MKKKMIGIFMYTLKVILVPNFRSLGLFLFSSAVNSCYQLLTAVDSWWHLIWKKFDWNFYVNTKVGTWAEFQLSSLISIFISCQQLLSAVDSCWQLMTADMKKKLTEIFMYAQKLVLVPNFSSLAWFSFSSVVNSWFLFSSGISCWWLLTADM